MVGLSQQRTNGRAGLGVSSLQTERSSPAPCDLAGSPTLHQEVLLRSLLQRVSGGLSWSGLWPRHKVGVMTGERIQ